MVNILVPRTYGKVDSMDIESANQRWKEWASSKLGDSSQDAQWAKTRQVFTPSGQVGMSLKRKVGYGGEDTAVIETRHKFQNMSVDEQSNM